MTSYLTKVAAPLDSARAGNHRAVLAVTCIALATVVSAVASLNVAIPSIARDTHASQTQLSWMVDAYALVFAALLLPAGALGDRYGRRKALLAGLAVFGAGSVAAMCYADAGWLIGMRAVLGVGAALVMPATLSTITSTFPPAQRARAVGTWAGVAGGSAILGLLTSGLVLEQWSWRSVFARQRGARRRWRSSARCASSPSRPSPTPRGVDWTGAALAVVGLGALVYSIIEAPTAGWASGRTLVGIGLEPRAARRLPRLGASGRRAAAGSEAVQAPRVRGRDVVHHAAVLRVLRVHLPAAAVPPAGPR